jgi:uncharacterized protein (TIGR03437 family)
MPLVRIPWFTSVAFFAAWRLLGADQPLPRVAPDYTAASIVNAADNQSGLAPYAIGTIYGTNLAYSTMAINQSNVQQGMLPVKLGAPDAVTVSIGNSPAALYYVSPNQINFLVPPGLSPGPVMIYVSIDGLHGPIVPLTLAPAAPGLFQLAPGTCQSPSGGAIQCAVATLGNGAAALTPSSPAKPGDVVVLWVTGLGATVPPPDGFQLPTAAARLVDGANLSVLLNGVAVDPGAIQYAGIAPGFGGLYQVNIELPMSTGAYPEIRLQLDGAISIPKVYLPVTSN